LTQPTGCVLVNRCSCLRGEFRTSTWCCRRRPVPTNIPVLSRKGRGLASSFFQVCSHSSIRSPGFGEPMETAMRRLLLCCCAAAGLLSLLAIGHGLQNPSSHAAEPLAASPVVLNGCRVRLVDEAVLASDRAGILQFIAADEGSR